MKTQYKILLIMLTFIWMAPDLTAQTRTYTATDESYVQLIGTSTLHDWEMRSDNIISELVFETANGETLESVESVSLVLETTSLRAEQSRLERTAHDEMDADDHPEITFRSNGKGTVVSNGDGYQVSTTGELTVSGVTRNVTVEANCVDNGEELVCAGSETLLMTDFDIDPPRMFLGTLRTDDEVTVEYHMVYRHSPELETRTP